MRHIYMHMPAFVCYGSEGQHAFPDIVKHYHDSNEKFKNLYPLIQVFKVYGGAFSTTHRELKLKLTY